MSYTAKKTFTSPIWALFVGLFILAGCQGGGSSGIGSESGQTAQQDNSSGDDSQQAASKPGSEESVAGGSPGEDISTGDEPAEESSPGTGGGTPGTGGETPVVDSTATLMWDAPAKRENGDTLKVGEIDYYVVSWGQDPDTLANTEEVPCVNCTDMEHVIEDLDEGTWYFTVQTRDTDGNLSRQADLATKQI